jgi:hypothetical protein
MNQDTAPQMNSPDFWLSLLSDFHINGSALTQSCERIPASNFDLARCRDNFRTEGYFQIDSVLPATTTSKLAGGVTRLRQKGIPLAIFSMLYDEYWLAFKQLSEILDGVLGDYMVVPDFWVWFVEANLQSTGFDVHRDVFYHSVCQDGLPNMLSIWIPLVDVGPENSCVYLVPSDLDKNHPYNLENISFSAQDLRAIPLKAGSILGFDSSLVHWGSRSTRHAITPRISYAYYIQRPHEGSKYKFGLNFEEDLPFEYRLQLVATQLFRYRRRETYSEFIQKFAEINALKELL